MLLRALCHSALSGAIIASTVVVGLFDAVTTDDGYQNYAEKPWKFLHSTCPWLAKLAMPGNTLVNIGYIAVAVYWLIYAKAEHSKNRISSHQAYMCYVFAWISLLYAPVQLLRILTQSHRFAILDQWYTLPIFSWVIVWSCFITDGWNPSNIITIVTVSSCSYCCTLLKIAGYEDKGFEVSLAIHIILAVLSGCKVYGMYPSRQALIAFFMAFICCVGFVGLKLSDHQLGKYHPFFRILSGHFWSKIADFLQIHFVFSFFMHTTNAVNEKIK